MTREEQEHMSYNGEYYQIMKRMDGVWTLVYDGCDRAGLTDYVRRLRPGQRIDAKTPLRRLACLMGPEYALYSRGREILPKAWEE